MKLGPWLLGLATALCVCSDSACAETFQQALVQAYETNPGLQAERAKLREVDEQVSQAVSNWRPSIDATGSIGKSYQNINDPPSAPIPSSNSALNTKSAGVQVTQPLFRGFRTVSATHAAEKKVEAERANLQAVEQKLFLDAGTAYLDVVQDQALVELDRHNVDVLLKELDAVQQRFDAGELTKTDIHQAQSRQKRAEADRIQAEGNLSNHRANYLHLIGQMPGALHQPELTLDDPKSLDEATTLAEKQNPNVVAASFGEDEARDEVDLNKGSLLPEIDLVGSTQRQWDQSSFIPGQQDTSQVVVQLTLPLYRSGAEYSKTREAQHAVTERRMQLEETRNQVRESAMSSWENLLTARGSLAADKEEQQAAELALKDVKQQAIVGSRTTLDVLNAEQELIDAKSGAIHAQHDVAVAILQIRSATGTLTAKALSLPVDLYDPEKNLEDVRGKWIGFADTSQYEHPEKDRENLEQKNPETSEIKKNNNDQTLKSEKPKDKPPVVNQTGQTPAVIAPAPEAKGEVEEDAKISLDGFMLPDEDTKKDEISGPQVAPAFMKVPESATQIPPPTMNINVSAADPDKG